MGTAKWELALVEAIGREASDVHFVPGQRIFLRLRGELTALEMIADEEMTADFINAALSATERAKLLAEREIDASYSFGGRRFRLNAYYAMGQLSIALRLIPAEIIPYEEIGLGMGGEKLLAAKSGLILVTGKTGAGKSTTLAAYIEAVNSRRARNIITLEDPVEYVHTPKKSLISQREYGRDFLAFPSALKSALREMPDVVMVGEIRDGETMATALAAADTGVLVLGTLHTRSAAETAQRVESLFPKSDGAAVRSQFAAVMTGIISQQLLPGTKGERHAATEILLANPAARNILRQGKYEQLATVIMSNRQMGMQAMDNSLDKLFNSGRISKECWEVTRGQG